MKGDNQNTNMRSHHIRMSQLNLQQKSAFKKLFDSGIQINYKDPKINKLVCQGVPSQYRLKVWSSLVENPHGITPKFYQLLLKKALVFISADPSHILPQRSRIVAHLNRIEQDIQRTYPELKIFRKDNDQGQALFNILAAWTVFREDVGYLQGMSQIAGLLLIEMPQLQAFSIFCAIMTTDVLFFYQNMEIQDIQFFQHNFGKRLKKGDEQFYYKLQSSGVQTRTFLLGWILTLFTRTMSLDMVTLLWDILFAHDLCQDILIQVAYYLVIALKQKMGKDAEPEQIHNCLKNFKLSQIQAFQIIQKIQQNYR